MAEKIHSALIDRLPPVRGRMSENAELGKVTWFRVGGPAEVMFRPTDRADLAAFLTAKPADVPVTVVGVASNLLVRDGGIPGVIIRLGRDFAAIAAEGSDIVCGAAALDLNVAKAACAAGIAGLAFLSGVPGTIGGGLRMNAGAYGKEIKDVLVAAEVIDGAGRLRWVDAEELGHSYRHSNFPDDWICVGARLRGEAGDPQDIKARMEDIQTRRAESQPIRTRTGGSTFKNPPGQKAWQLIEAAGCRGLVVGDAMVSELHCNFLINRGAATAQDLEALGEEVRNRVRQTTGVDLEWEIKRIGVRLDGGDAGGAA